MQLFNVYTYEYARQRVVEHRVAPIGKLIIGSRNISSSRLKHVWFVQVQNTEHIEQNSHIIVVVLQDMQLQ